LPATPDVPLKVENVDFMVSSPALVRFSPVVPLVLAAGLGIGACDFSPSEPTASLNGVVRLYDELGQVLPESEGVFVSLRDQASGELFEQTTGEDGVFSFPNLTPSRYDLELSKDGFGEQKAFGQNLGSANATAGLPQLSSLEILSMDVSAGVCTGTPCLDIDLATRNASPEGFTRRVFRAYLGPTTLPNTPTDYQESFAFVVEADDPGVTQSADTTFFAIRGLFVDYLLGIPSATEVLFLLHGSTENQSLSYSNKDRTLSIYSDLSSTFGDETFINP
jgi:hypothetical protein